MTKDNEDALGMAESCMECHEPHMPEYRMAAHLRRLVRENEALRADVDHKDAFAEQLGRDLMSAQREIEAKDALLRQAVEAWDNEQSMRTAIVDIRQHLEGRAS